MCQIISKVAGLDFNLEKLDRAQTFNEDGYGVSWYEDSNIETFKTMNYDRFKLVLKMLKDVPAIAHLRNATRGTICADNAHPFVVPSGVMFHNGTVSSMSHCSTGGSDTKQLADLLNECDYNYVEDIMPLIKSIIGDKINRLAFLEVDGTITLVNKELGMVEEDIWYSNDYHKRVIPKVCTPTIVATPKTTKVFVYGTLKKGLYNHSSFLGNAKFVGNAKSVSRWDMIGEGMPFPYLLGRNDEGLQIEGEVYEVTVDEAKALDRLEGVPTHYRKSYMYVSFMDGKPSSNVTVYVKATVTADNKVQPKISNFTAQHMKRLTLVG